MTSTRISSDMPRSLASLLLPALQPLPQWPLQTLLGLAVRHMSRRHPSIFERLQSLGPATIAIDVTDLPCILLFGPNVAGGRLRLVERGEISSASATISGPLGPLAALLQGKCDGDALFFSRVIAIEGHTAVVVALRNAIDNSEVDLLADFAAIFGPARGLAEGLLRYAARSLRPLQRV